MNPSMYAAWLNSEERKQHSAAAAFLPSEGLAGYQHLPSMLKRLKEVDLDPTHWSKYDEHFVYAGTRTVSKLVRLRGFDERDQDHDSVLQWNIDLTNRSTPNLVYAGIWGLGDLGVPPMNAHDRLVQIINSDTLPNAPQGISCRGLAFRMLSLMDRTFVLEYIASAACNEYLDGVKYWIAGYSDESPEAKSLRAEMAWLHEIRG